MGEDLTSWRKLRELTAAEVADRAGVGVNTVLRLEKGNGATLENVLRIARALGVLDAKNYHKLILNAVEYGPLPTTAWTIMKRCADEVSGQAGRPPPAALDRSAHRRRMTDR